MNCRKANNLISAYIDGELSGVEHIMVREHLDQCADCREEYDTLVSMKRTLASIKMQAPRTELPSQIMARIHAEAGASQSASLPRWEIGIPPKRKLFYGAGLTAIALVAVLAFSKDPNEIRWTSTANEPRLTAAPSAMPQSGSFYTPQGSYAAPVASSYTRFGEPENTQSLPPLSANNSTKSHPRTQSTTRP